MKVLLVGFLLCLIAGIGAQLSDDVEIPGGVQDDSSSPVSWFDLFSKLTAFMHGKKEPDIESPMNLTIPDQALDDHAADELGNDDGYDIATTVVYEDVTVTDISIGDIEDGDMINLNRSETVSPASYVTTDVIRNEGSNDSASQVSITNDKTPPYAENDVPPTPSYLNPNLSLKEAIALFRDYQEQETLQGQQKGGGVRQELQNSTVHTGTTLGQLEEDTLLSLPNETMQPKIVGADDSDIVSALDNLAPAFSIDDAELKSNSTQLSPNSTSSSYAVSSAGNESQTDGPGMDATLLPGGVDTTSLVDLGQTDAPNPENVTVLDTMPTSVSNTPSHPTVSHHPFGTEDDMISLPSTDYEVVEASTESTPTELPRQFWIANDKGDDDDSDSKENDIIDDIDMSSNSSHEEGNTERLTNMTTPKCDWMGSNKNNAFIKLIDRLCHTIKPLPIIFNVLILLTLGIISVVVCRIACLCIRCRRRKRDEDKDSLIEPGSRKEKKSLLQV